MSILELVFNPIFDLVSVILSVVPHIYLPESFDLAFETLDSFIPDVGFFIPLVTVMNIIMLTLVWYSIIFSIRFIVFVLKKVPFFNIN